MQQSSSDIEYTCNLAHSFRRLCGNGSVLTCNTSFFSRQQGSVNNNNIAMTCNAHTTERTCSLRLFSRVTGDAWQVTIQSRARMYVCVCVHARHTRTGQNCTNVILFYEKQVSGATIRRLLWIIGLLLWCGVVWGVTARGFESEPMAHTLAAADLTALQPDAAGSRC